MQVGDLILLDVAAEYANYNSDLTRTIPVSGKSAAKEVPCGIEGNARAIKLMYHHQFFLITKK